MPGSHDADLAWTGAQTTKVCVKNLDKSQFTKLKYSSLYR